MIQTDINVSIWSSTWDYTYIATVAIATHNVMVDTLYLTRDVILENTHSAIYTAAWDAIDSSTCNPLIL